MYKSCDDFAKPLAPYKQTRNNWNFLSIKCLK